MKLPSLSKPLTSCCAALFLTDHRSVPGYGLGVGDPWCKIRGDQITNADSKKWLNRRLYHIVVVQSLNRVQPCNPVNCSTQSKPAFPVLHYLPELAQTHPLSWWCHPIISSSVIPFSSCPQCFPASGSFSMSWLFASGGQSTRASASALPMNIQGRFPLGLTGVTSLLSKGLSRVFSNTTVQKHQFFGTQPSLWSNSHICKWPLERHLLHNGVFPKAW